MATDVSYLNTIQALADATCLIYDRSVVPERVVGEGWLVSKSRIVTLASCVTNYTEAPWALIARFPHPDLTYAVKTVSLHPDFNKREARDAYLAQVHSPYRRNFDHDIASIILEPELTAAAPERIAELNRALSLPFPTSPSDLSGLLRAGEAPMVIQNSIMTGRSGLLTMLDGRNIPFARIQIRAGRLARGMYNNLTNELAICEVIWRKPSGNYVFQTTENFNWGELPEISIPTEQLANEANRRAQELPQIIDQLGGPDMKFQKVRPDVDFSSMNPQQRWVADRLWETLDGFVPLNKLSERISSDTYTILRTLLDLRAANLVTGSEGLPFHMNGQLGQPLVLAAESEVNFWDQVTAFYLDPASGNPAVYSGNFVGAGNLQSPKTLMHTVPLPPNTLGALILKDGKVVGVHAGPCPPRGSQMPFAVSQMQAINSLNDLGVKRLRSTEQEAMPSLEPDQSISGRLPSSRQRFSDGTVEASQAENAAAVAKMEEETGPLARFTKNQIAAAGLIGMGVLLIITLISIMSRPASDPAVVSKPTASTAAKPEATNDITEALRVATTRAGFKETPLDTYRYEDTSKLNLGKESFQMVSDRYNQRMIFAVWPNADPIKDLEEITKLLPFSGAARRGSVIQKGADGPVTWNLSKYEDMGASKQFLATVAAFPCQGDPGKCMVMVATAEDPKKDYSSEPSLFLIEHMFAKTPSTGSGDEQTTEKSEATPAELGEYRKKVLGLVKGAYKAPKDDSEAEFDRVAAILIAVNQEGNFTKKEFAHSSDKESFNTALLKAVESLEPLPAPPPTKNDKYEMLITANDGAITVEEP